MRFQLVHRGKIPENEKWMRHLKGEVYYNAQGNRYLRPDHMSQAGPESNLTKLLVGAEGDWYVTYTDNPVVIELIRLLNKLAPVPISPFISP